MHKFNFQIETQDNNDYHLPYRQGNRINEIEVEEAVEAIDKPSPHAFQEVSIKPEMLEYCNLHKSKAMKWTVHDISIDYLVAGAYFENEENCIGGSDDSIRLANKEHSDLIAGVYEGGGKVWECTNDLLDYLSQHLFGASFNLQQTLVLDLGCGTGLLGIYAYLHGANVDFQDYNKDVLELITIPNVVLNANATNHDLQALQQRVRFYSGDWANWCNHTDSNNQYDFIFTSETIYNPANYQTLLNCMHDKLKPDGVILLAAKTIYFGVGGGLRQFEYLVNTDQRFQFKVLWSSQTGISREIIELRKRIAIPIE